MAKFILLKNENINYPDKFLKEKFSKKYDFIVLTLPGIPYLMHIVSIMACDHIEFFYPGNGINMVITDFTNEKNISCWLIDRQEYARRGKKIIKDKDFIRKIFKDYNKAYKNFYSFIFKLEKKGINKAELNKDFIKLVKLYIKQYSIAYTITGPVTQAYSDIIINKLLKKYNLSCHIKDAIKIFTKPSHNFLLKESNNLNKIADLIKKQKLSVKTLRILKTESLDIYNKIIAHQKKYYWIASNYKDIKFLNPDYFFKRIKKIMNNQEDSFQEKKSRINDMSIYRNIAGNDIITLKLLGKIAGLQDQRKKANLIANYWLFEFLKIIAKREKTPVSLLKFASLWEVIELLNTGNVDMKEISKRKKGCMNIVFKGKREYWLTGANYQFIKKKIAVMQAVLGKNYISGTAASSGKARGRVKIVLDIKREGNKIKKGDILVTSMTRPEFMPFLSKIGGIITNEGGITSHAAVISRELKIPCIVGTGNATQVLKDGQIIEVDANKGVVMIIN